MTVLFFCCCFNFISSGQAIFTPAPPCTFYVGQEKERTTSSSAFYHHSVSMSRKWRLSKMTEVAEWLVSRYEHAVDRAGRQQSLLVKGAVEKRMLRNACKSLASFVMNQSDKFTANVPDESFAVPLWFEKVHANLQIERKVEWIESAAQYVPVVVGCCWLHLGFERVLLLLCVHRYRRLPRPSKGPPESLADEAAAAVSIIENKLLGGIDTFGSPLSAVARFEAALVTCPLLRHAINEHFLPTVVAYDPELQGHDIVVQQHDVQPLRTASKLLREAIEILKRSVGRTHVLYSRYNIIAGKLHQSLRNP